jgi:signal transduction histidine kinase
VHELKEAEAARDRALTQARIDRARLRQVLMQAPAAICVLRGADLVLETANCRYLELLGNRDVVGKPLREVLPAASTEGLLTPLEGVYATGEPYIGVEERVVGVEDAEDERCFNFVYQPLFDGGGSPTGIVVHAVDVSDLVRGRRQVERQVKRLGQLTDALRQSNEDLDQFAYVASHDLKAPLRGIATISEWLEEDLGGDLPPQSQEHLERLRGRVKRMEGLIDGLLQYSRAGHHQEDPRDVNVGQVVEEVLDLLSPPQELQVEVAEDLPTLETEQFPLQQVLQNLLSNAIKHSNAEKPRVQIGWEEAGEMVRIWVQDNGPGIDPRYHDKIWRIFLTLKARDEVEGTGIGLSLVKKLVERRGGRVWVDSRPGEGATFHFLWPKRFSGETL